MSCSASEFRYVFGPVSSRRLGRSLGVDLLPYKTCSLDCIYCECGPTTTLTDARQAWVPTARVLEELDAFLISGPELDYVTFSGSGEPTLHRDLGLIIEHLKTRYPRYKVAVLTNGTLFADPAARRDVLRADLLVPSLDGATPQSFAAIDRPHAAIRVEAVIDGLVELRREFTGTLALVVFVVPGVNDSDAEVEALRDAAARIRPDAIQLNRLDRAGSDPTLRPATDEEMADLRDRLAPFPVVIVPNRTQGSPRRVGDAEVESALLSILRVRPSTTTTLAFLTGISEGLVAKHVQQMLSEGRLERVPPEAGLGGSWVRAIE